MHPLAPGGHRIRPRLTSAAAPAQPPPPPTDPASPAQSHPTLTIQTPMSGGSMCFRPASSQNVFARRSALRVPRVDETTRRSPTPRLPSAVPGRGYPVCPGKSLTTTGLHLPPPLPAAAPPSRARQPPCPARLCAPASAMPIRPRTATPTTPVSPVPAQRSLATSTPQVPPAGTARPAICATSFPAALRRRRSPDPLDCLAFAPPATAPTWPRRNGQQAHPHRRHTHLRSMPVTQPLAARTVGVCAS